MNSLYDFKYLKSIVPIDRVLSAYGLLQKLTLRNRRLAGPCPLHGGDNPTAFRAHLDRGIWNCFTACGGGDTVELVRKIENCSYAEAARILKELSTGFTTKTGSKPHCCGRNVFRPFERRISLNPKTPFLQENKKISIDTAIRFEAGTTVSSSFLKGTVAVRLHDLYGNPIGYCGRRLNPNEIEARGKWRFPWNFPKNLILYNAHRAVSHRKYGVIVVECPWSAMRLSQSGSPNVVALLGTSLSSIQSDWLKAAPSALLMLDGDDAGRKAATSIVEKLYGKIKTFVYHLPDGFDPDDLSDDDLRAIVSRYYPSFP
jgi:DNA primase